MPATREKPKLNEVRDAGAVRSFGDARPLTRAQLLAAPVHWPRPSRLLEPVADVGKRGGAALGVLGIENVGGLLEHLPRASRGASTIADLRAGEQTTIEVEVRRISKRAVRRRRMRPLVQADVFDATGTLRATFFNQPWLAERYPPGTRLLLHGRADGRGGMTVSSHSAATGGEEADELGVSVSHYPASEGISSLEILNLVRAARPHLADVVEPLPAAVRVAAGIPDRAAALAAAHFRAGEDEAELGRRRLAFEELLLAQLLLQRRRAARHAREDATALDGAGDVTARWLAALPFTPTADQGAAMRELDLDLRRRVPMNRLLMGEVGSGKTVVALYAMLRAVECGHQAALMAPTETLAEQHFATLQRLIGSEPVSAALLTGATPAARRRETLGHLADGSLSLIVGTHALIEPDVRFASLAVAVVDEQHRFGVRQRAALDGKGSPHVLHMTATPIPRTLALARYGDLDTTFLRTLPAGRRPVETVLLSGQRGRGEAYALLRGELAAGRQAYVVCPLIDAAEEEEETGGAERLRAATEELERLRATELAGHRLALLHGGMAPREKQAAMAAFAAGEVDVLVATTVIEVGIDVANATVMVIENAERFGISQLHQLRGRVGRGAHSSTCLLIGSTDGGSRRLQAVASTADGFRLAEIDLRLRSEGELTGTRQSGLGTLRFARLPDDADLLERARDLARTVMHEDRELARAEHALLAAALAREHGAGALAPIDA
ncbi:MAG TPA: ATP-dependent DNA helicase RecG [Solirubrobacteraceae bacterium]|nr:ATP-dependent DNA helicase RecG [Solirubrobacteraceae bacterium]